MRRKKSFENLEWHGRNRCEENHRAEYGKKYSATVTNGTLFILRRVLDIAVDAGVRYDNPAKAKQVKRVSAKRVEAAGTGPILYAHQASSGC